MLHHPLQPNAARTPLSICKIHIQNLVDLFQACLQRGEFQRATRAWSILIRCREVDWRSRWRWGLALLTATNNSAPAAQRQRDDIDIAQWLRALRVTIPSDEKPAVLHALSLHLIRQAQYREAFDELETYLTSYPYLLSGPLHTYAGMLAFYLAQPASLRVEGTGTAGTEGGASGSRDDIGADDDSDMSSPRLYPVSRTEAPNLSLIRQARGWFVEAQNIGEDEVAAEFVRLIDSGTSDRSLDMSDDEDEEPGVQSRKQPISLVDMLHPPGRSSDEDDEEEEEEMVDTMHEYE